MVLSHEVLGLQTAALLNLDYDDLAAGESRRGLSLEENAGGLMKFPWHPCLSKRQLARGRHGHDRAISPAQNLRKVLSWGQRPSGKAWPRRDYLLGPLPVSLLLFPLSLLKAATQMGGLEKGPCQFQPHRKALSPELDQLEQCG